MKIGGCNQRLITTKVTKEHKGKQRSAFSTQSRNFASLNADCCFPLCSFVTFAVKAFLKSIEAGGKPGGLDQAASG